MALYPEVQHKRKATMQLATTEYRHRDGRSRKTQTTPALSQTILMKSATRLNSSIPLCRGLRALMQSSCWELSWSLDCRLGYLLYGTGRTHFFTTIIGTESIFDSNPLVLWCQYDTRAGECDVRNRLLTRYSLYHLTQIAEIVLSDHFCDSQ